MYCQDFLFCLFLLTVLSLRAAIGAPPTADANNAENSAQKAFDTDAQAGKVISLDQGTSTSGQNTSVDEGGAPVNTPNRNISVSEGGSLNTAKITDESTKTQIKDGEEKAEEKADAPNNNANDQKGAGNDIITGSTHINESMNINHGTANSSDNSAGKDSKDGAGTEKAHNKAENNNDPEGNGNEEVADASRDGKDGSETDQDRDDERDENQDKIQVDSVSKSSTTTQSMPTTTSVFSTEEEGDDDTYVPDEDNNIPNKDPGTENQGKKKNKGADLIKSKHQEWKDVVPQDYDGEFEKSSSGHFMAYFLTATVLCIAGYVIFHNKQKIIAFIVEGRSTNGRRPSSKNYQKLKTKVDDVLPALEKSTTNSNYVY